MDRPRKRRHPFLLGTLALAGLAFGSGCATFSPGAGGSLHDEVDGIISRRPLDQVNWGIQVIDPNRGQILYSRHGYLKFVPASNMKILATATALSLLGPEYRYRTSLWAIGQRGGDGQILDGDLVLAPSGDPTFSDRFYPSPEAPLDSLAQGLWDSGIRRVTGSVVVDASQWDSTTVPGTWEVDDLVSAYGATGGAFSLAEGVLTLEVTAGEESGDPATVRWWPEIDPEFLSAGFRTVSRSDSTESSRRIEYLSETGRLRVAGRIPVGEVDTIRISQRTPVPLATRSLLRAVERRGIQVDGGARIAWDRGEPLGRGACVSGNEPQGRWADGLPSSDPLGLEPNRMAQDRYAACSDAALLMTVESPPMSDVVRAILEPSQNWITEQLVRTLGWELGEEGSWREGFRIEREFLTRRVSVDTLDVTLRDGSGLSAKNLVTPRGMVRILDYMRESPHSGVFREALASPGEEDSTLRNRLDGLETQLFAKTGTITHVSSLSGYLYTESGKVLIFSIMANDTGLPSRPAREAIDAIVKALARY
jgi:D-alanyl-D-alanine carboxypeptidase/D-alanyl-D-alanine-endopeptidase (penicillin-binding protein 4)